MLRTLCVRTANHVFNELFRHVLTKLYEINITLTTAIGLLTAVKGYAAHCCVHSEDTEGHRNIRDNIMCQRYEEQYSASQTLINT